MADIRKKHDRAWLVRWRENGKQKYRQFRTEADAESFRRGVEMTATARRVLSGPAPWDFDAPPMAAEDAGMSVAGYARRMLDADRDLRSTTRALYERNIRHHLAETALGKMDIRHVSPADVSEWWAGLRDVNSGKPAGPGVRRNAQQLLARAFNRAVLIGDIDVSPLKRAPEIRRPRSRKRDIALTLGQLESLADAAAEGRDRPDRSRRRDRLIILVMGFGGLRAGEVGGLRVSDLHRDGRRCRLRVSRAVIRETGSAAYIFDLKTEAGRRTVSVPCSVADEIAAYIAEFGIDGALFSAADGGLMARNNIAHVVGSAGKRAGITTHAHALRHTAASIAVQAGANPEALRAMLGHTDVRLTLQTYTHLFDWGADEVADTMERLREEHRNGA